MAIADSDHRDLLALSFSLQVFSQLEVVNINFMQSLPVKATDEFQSIKNSCLKNMIDQSIRNIIGVTRLPVRVGKNSQAIPFSYFLKGPDGRGILKPIDTWRQIAQLIHDTLNFLPVDCLISSIKLRYPFPGSEANKMNWIVRWVNLLSGKYF